MLQLILLLLNKIQYFTYKIKVYVIMIGIYSTNVKNFALQALDLIY